MTRTDTYSDRYLDSCAGIITRVRAQQENIQLAAKWCSDTILAGRMVHVFGSGHSRMMVEEMWPRYGSFPGWNPIVELSLSFHNLVVGANGQRHSRFTVVINGHLLFFGFYVDNPDIRYSNQTIFVFTHENLSKFPRCF